MGNQRFTTERGNAMGSICDRFLPRKGRGGDPRGYEAVERAATDGWQSLGVGVIDK